MIPFDTVYIHGTVRADDGRKMSKSLGNSIDPLDIIEEFSADALRFSLMMITATGQDIYVSNDKFEIGRNFGTKIWNAARFMQMHSDGAPTGDWSEALVVDAALLSPDDKHILMRLNDAIAACDENLGKYRFNDAAHALYEFVWHHYCDWYVEYAKEALNGDDVARREQVLKIMHYCFSNAIRLLHPMMPFLTEELWHAMGYAGKLETIMRAPWPTALTEEQLAAAAIDRAAVEYVDAKHDMVRVGRLMRTDYGIAPGARIDFMIRPHTQSAAELLASDTVAVRASLRAETVTVDLELNPEKAMPSAVSQLGTLYLPVADVIDIPAELERLNGELAKINGHLTNTTRKLENESFTSKAPENVVAQVRATKGKLLADAEKIQNLIDALQG